MAQKAKQGGQSQTKASETHSIMLSHYATHNHESRDDVTSPMAVDNHRHCLNPCLEGPHQEQGKLNISNFLFKEKRKTKKKISCIVTMCGFSLYEY